MHVEVGLLVLIRPSLFTFDVYQLIGMARCESHCFPLARNPFAGEKLGEQMIPIIRRPTVLITIPRTMEPPTRGLTQTPALPFPAYGPGASMLLPPASPAPRSARGPTTSSLSPQEQRRCSTGRSFGAAQRFSGTKAAAYATALSFFPSFFHFSLAETMAQQQLIGNV